VRHRDLLGEQPQGLGRHQWAVDREHQADVVCGGAQSREDAEHGCPLLGLVVEHRKRQIERVLGPADGNDLLENLPEHPPSALGERLAAEVCHGLRGPEPLGPAPDEQDAGRSHAFRLGV
jgi:hypothetical protein